MGNNNGRGSGDCMNHNRDSYNSYNDFTYTPSTTTLERHLNDFSDLNYCYCGVPIQKGRKLCTKCKEPRKYYCLSCSNYEVSSCGDYCSSCAERSSERRAMEQANEEFETERSKTAGKNNYIHITNNCENETRNLIQPSRFNNKWAVVNHELKLVYQHKKLNNKRVYLWKHCQIYCRAKSHTIFDHSGENWPQPNHSTRNSFDVIYQVLDKKECSQCQEEMKAVKDKIKQFENQQNNLLTALQLPQASEATSTQIKFSEVTQLEIELNETLEECKEAIESVQNIVSESKNIADEEEGTATYESQIDLDTFTKKALGKQNEITRQKQNVFRFEKQLDTKKNDIIKRENEIDDQLIRQKESRSTLNEQYKSVDKLRVVLNAMMVNKSESDLAGNEIERLNKLINELLKQLHEKYAEHEQRVEELNKCKVRVGTIRQKLEKQKGENKYLLQLLEEEYNRLNTATENAIKKFEENGIYFLSVTVGLNENIIDKFVECGCDKLDDIMDMNDENLIEVGIQSGIMRKKILKQIHLLNEKFKESNPNNK